MQRSVETSSESSEFSQNRVSLRILSRKRKQTESNEPVKKPKAGLAKFKHDSEDPSSESDSDWSEPPKRRSKKSRKLVRPKIVLRVERIISWRYSNKQKELREYLVKFKEMNMFETEWVEEKYLVTTAKSCFSHYRKKCSLDEEPERLFITEDNPCYKRVERMAPDFEMFTAHLQEEFYQYGVHPEELIVHRIIGHRVIGKLTEYLTKWRGLPYSKCTWEVFNTNYPQLEASIDYYNQHRSYNLHLSVDQSIPRTAKFFIPPTAPLTDLNEQLLVQPESVGETGLNLHGYQLDGLNWLRRQCQQKVSCILGETRR